MMDLEKRVPMNEATGSIGKHLKNVPTILSYSANAALKWCTALIIQLRRKKPLTVNPKMPTIKPGWHRVKNRKGEMEYIS